MEIHESCNDSIKVDNEKVFHSIKLDILTYSGMSRVEHIA